MKKIIFSFPLFLFAFYIRSCPAQGFPVNDNTLNIVWVDEFQGPIIDPAKWCRDDWHRGLHNSNDCNSYRSLGNDNLIFCPNCGTQGTVTQVVRQEDFTFYNQNKFTLVYENWTYHYTSPAWFMSQQKFKYGFFEIRCKLPELHGQQNNSGFGANFWLNWSDEIPNPSYLSSEIDWFEFICKSDTPHVQTFNAHHQPVWKEDPPFSEGASGNHMVSPDFSTFHTFSGIWTPENIKYYLDGRLLHVSTFYPSEMIPMRMRVDINVFTGAAGLGNISEVPNANTVIPYRYEIDYVKVWGLNMSKCKTDFVNCDPFLVQPSVYRNVTIGGGGCNYSFPTGATKSIWASQSIVIEPPFEIQPGASFSLDISPCYEQEIIECNPVQCNRCPD